MKKVFFKILSVFMAVVVVFTTMAMTVDLHYCGDSLVDLSLFQKSEGCGMEKPLTSNDFKSAVSQDSCCSDQQIVKEANNELKNTFDKFSFKQQILFVSFFYTYSNLFEGFNENIIPFKNYSPPFIERDIQKLYALYLI